MEKAVSTATKNPSENMVLTRSISKRRSGAAQKLAYVAAASRKPRSDIVIVATCIASSTSPELSFSEMTPVGEATAAAAVEQCYRYVQSFCETAPRRNSWFMPSESKAVVR